MKFTPLFRFVPGEFQGENLQLLLNQSLNNNWTSQTASHGGVPSCGRGDGTERLRAIPHINLESELAKLQEWRNLWPSQRKLPHLKHVNRASNKSKYTVQQK